MSKKITITLIDGDYDHIINKVDVMSGELGKRRERHPFGEETSLDKINGGRCEGDQFCIVMCEDCEWLFEGTEEELIAIANEADSVD